MDVIFIQAFAKAIENVFAMMVQTEVAVQEPVLKTVHDPRYDVSGIIAISGDMVGVVVLSFPAEVAERVATSFTGMTLGVQDEDFADAIGELVNMVSGNAKASFEGKQCQISCPTVIIGQNHQVFKQRDLQSIQLPCRCDCGEFILEVSIKGNNKDSSTKTSLAATRSAS